MIDEAATKARSWHMDVPLLHALGAPPQGLDSALDATRLDLAKPHFSLDAFDS